MDITVTWHLGRAEWGSCTLLGCRFYFTGQRVGLRRCMARKLPGYIGECRAFPPEGLGIWNSPMLKQVTLPLTLPPNNATSPRGSEFFPDI